MQEICVITTGGTIDSVAAGDSLGVTETVSDRLKDLLNGVAGEQAAWDTVSPLNKNSEDFSLADIEAIAEAVDRKAQDGQRRFLITHGSDTLHFTAAALGFAFAGRGLTICLVAAFRPLTDSASDGPDNLRAATQWLLSGDAPPDAYVALKEDIDAASVLIAHWRDVKPLDFDSRGLASLRGAYVARYSAAGLSLTAPAPRPGPETALPFRGLGAQSPNVRLINAYVGLDGAVLSALGAQARIVVIGAYHSGTLPASEDPETGVTAHVRGHPQTLFLLARHPDRLAGYASAKRFEAAGGMVLRHLLPHQAYILAGLLAARGDDVPAMRAAFAAFCRPTGA